MQRKANPAALKKVTGLAFLRHFVRCIPKSEGDLPRGTLQLREEHGFDDRSVTRSMLSNALIAPATLPE